jgi:CRP/FNR family transcriptional regulator, anaerobic regulatory protein
MYRRFPEFNFVGRVITERYYALSEDRIAALRILRAQERYDYVYENFPQLIQRIPLKYLASYLGVSEVILK